MLKNRLETLKLTLISGVLLSSGAANAIFRFDLNEIDPDEAYLAHQQQLIDQGPANQLVDLYHQELLHFIDRAIASLTTLLASQVNRVGQQDSIKSALAHLTKAQEKAVAANQAHHEGASTRQPHTNDQVDFSHARLMEELKKAEQHVYNLGYVSLKHRSDILADIQAAETAATKANQAHHDQKPDN